MSAGLGGAGAAGSIEVTKSAIRWSGGAILTVAALVLIYELAYRVGFLAGSLG